MPWHLMPGIANPERIKALSSGDCQKPQPAKGSNRRPLARHQAVNGHNLTRHLHLISPVIVVHATYSH